MEKRALLAFALTFLVIALWVRFIAPAPETPPSPSPEPAADLPAAEPIEPEPVEAPPVEAGATAPVGPQAVEETRRQVVVETERSRITLSNRGAVVTSWILKDYIDEDGQELEIVSPGTERLARFPLGLRLEDPELDQTVNEALFQVERESVDTADGPAQRVRFRFHDGRGLEVEKSLTFPPRGFLSEVKVKVRTPGDPVPSSIQLGPGFSRADAPKGASRFFVLGRALLFDAGKLRKIDPKQLEPGEIRNTTGNFRWAGIEDTYFASVLIPDDGGVPEALVRSDRWVSEGVERKLLSLELPLESGGGNFGLFVGPKDLDVLAGLESELVRMVDFRPRDPFGILPTISRMLLSALKFIYRGVHNYGWAIVILTIAIRVLFFPLTQRSSVSMRKVQQKMKRVQPKVQSIREKYRKHRKDPMWRQKMNQEVMQLYQKEGVNPLASLGGCLPMLLQLPILFGFYSLLMVAIELRQAPFIFWLQDLSRKDPYYITPIVMGVTMFLQQRMTTPAGMDPMQRRMMMMMPLVFTFFFVNFPSGLVLYWLVSNLFGIGQQYLINRQADRLVSGEIGARHGKLQRVSR